jgi:hypothetical protein
MTIVQEKTAPRNPSRADPKGSPDVAIPQKKRQNKQMRAVSQMFLVGASWLLVFCFQRQASHLYYGVHFPHVS